MDPVAVMAAVGEGVWECGGDVARLWGLGTADGGLSDVLETSVLRLAERCKLKYNVRRMMGKEDAMDREELLNRITVNPDVLVGKPTIRGMRISVEQILDALAAGVPEQELLEDYTALEADDIRAVLLYAREVVASERVYPINTPVPA